MVQTFALFVNTPVAERDLYLVQQWGDDRLAGGSFEIDMSKSGSTTTMKVLMATIGGTAQSKTRWQLGHPDFHEYDIHGGPALPTTTTAMTQLSAHQRGSFVGPRRARGAVGHQFLQ